MIKLPVINNNNNNNNNNKIGNRLTKIIERKRM